MIQPTGPASAKIMLIGEAPGETEERLGIPFVGQAGKVLDGILEEAGIPRALCYITNVMLERPSGNKFSHFYTKVGGKKVETPELLEGYARIHNEIGSVQPNVIVPLGNEAMKAVLGHGGVMDWRGSVLESPWGKVIPTIHPAAVLRNWSFRPAVVHDFNRVGDESEFREIRKTKRDLIVAYDTKEALRYVEEFNKQAYVAFDVETESGQITCIGLSSDPKRAVCIPFWFGGSGSLRSEEEEGALWRAIRGLLESTDAKKIAHNGAYDIGVLQRTLNIRVDGFWFDTMAAMHALYLELPKSLAFATSIYTDQPYYKYQRKSDSMDTHFLYNATDACITYELAFKLVSDMEDEHVSNFYFEHLHPLINVLLEMELKGVRFDVEGCKRERTAYRNKLKLLQEQVNKEAGHELNVGSHKQMVEWLYNELKYPKVLKLDKETGTRKVTADEDALEKCLKHKPNKTIEKVLSIRELSKIHNTYLNVKLDPDKRIRCSYNIAGTETGRLSSSKTAHGTGTNLQNIPNGVVKKLFLADPGYVLINADLSQAEARVVAYLANEERLIEVFKSGGDIHRKNAANIFNIKESEVSDEQRQLAKRVVHASNYGMGPRTFASEVGIDERDARRLLNKYFATYPRIGHWHLQMEGDLKRSRRLVTPLGRQRFFYNRWSSSLLKEGLAYVPQSCVADVVNIGLVRLAERIKEDKLDIHILLQVHDSMVVQCKDSKEDIERAKRVIKDSLDVPIELHGRAFTIPVDFKIGYNWGVMK